MIRQLSAGEVFEYGPALCELLWDAVAGGASIGFLPPLDPIEALAYWDSVRQAIFDDSRLLIVAFQDDELIAAVQLDLATKPNALHRAEVCKLMVHRKARRRGLAAALMQSAEQAAQSLHRTLLVLDTRKGDPSEALYRKLGYITAGEIPNYARSADGTLHTTMFFYKLIAGAEPLSKP